MDGRLLRMVELMKSTIQEVKRVRTVADRLDEWFTYFGIVLVIFLVLFA